MRIGIEAQRVFRVKKHGMDIYALQLIRHLQLCDTTNDYFIFVKKDVDVCLKETANFKIIVFDSFFYVDWEQILLPYKIHSYNLDFLLCTGNTAPLYCPVPLLITLHDVIFLDSKFIGGTYYQRLGYFYRKWLVPKIIQKAKKIYTVSKHEAGIIETHFNNKEQLEVVYNGISPYFFSPFEKGLAKKIKKQFKFPEKYLLFLGNEVPKKNMNRVIKAYILYCQKATNPMDLVILETNSKTIRKQLKKEGAIKLLDKIYLPGYIENHLLPQIYFNAYLFLYPSIRESFGLPILEAMASGTPVIASNIPAIKEVGQEAPIYVDPYDVDVLANTIIALEDNPQQLQKIIALGNERVKSFSWKSAAQQILKSFNEIFF